MRPPAVRIDHCVSAIISAFVASACGATATANDAGVFEDDGAPIVRVDARPGPTCDQVTPVTVTVGTPDLLLVVDKSQSMQSSLLSGENKWLTMRDALASVTEDFGESIYFGLSLYPRGAACDAGEINVEIALNNSANVVAALDSVTPVGATPTHLTLDVALTYFASLPVNPAGRYVLLATDGVPNCGYDPITDRNSGQVSSKSEAVAAIGALRSADITTFVVGFDQESLADDSALVAMAEAAGTAPYLEASSPNELRTAFANISSQIGMEICSLNLSAVPEDPDKLGVYFDDVQVPRTPSHADGWDYDEGCNCISFYGAACDQLRGSQVETTHVDYGCPGPVVD